MGSSIFILCSYCMVNIQHKPLIQSAQLGLVILQSIEDFYCSAQPLKSGRLQSYTHVHLRPMPWIVL